VIKEFYRSEREKLESMPSEKKRQYVLDYYIIWIIGILAAFFFIGYFIYHAAKGGTEYLLYVAVPGVSETAAEELEADFTDYAGYDTSAGEVFLQSTLYFDPTTNEGTNNSYYQSFVAMVEAGDMDAVIMTTAQIQAIGRSGRLLDLGSESCAKIYEKYSDRLVYAEPYDESYETNEDGLVPIGIDISDSLVVTKYHLYDEDAVLGICAYSGRIDEVERFLEYIFGEIN